MALPENRWIQRFDNYKKILQLKEKFEIFKSKA